MQSLTAMGQMILVDNENDGALIGDSTLREIKGQLREMSSTAIKGYEGGPYYLSYPWCVNIRDGSINFDKSQLESQFKATPETVRAFLANNYSTSNSNISISQPLTLLIQNLGHMLFQLMVLHTQLVVYQPQKVVITISVSSGDPQGLDNYCS